MSYPPVNTRETGFIRTSGLRQRSGKRQLHLPGGSRCQRGPVPAEESEGHPGLRAEAGGRGEASPEGPGSGEGQGAWQAVTQSVHGEGRHRRPRCPFTAQPLVLSQSPRLSGTGVGLCIQDSCSSWG